MGRGLGPSGLGPSGGSFGAGSFGARLLRGWLLRGWLLRGWLLRGWLLRGNGSFGAIAIIWDFDKTLTPIDSTSKTVEVLSNGKSDEFWADIKDEVVPINYSQEVRTYAPQKLTSLDQGKKQYLSSCDFSQVH